MSVLLVWVRMKPCVVLSLLVAVRECAEGLFVTPPVDEEPGDFFGEAGQVLTVTPYLQAGDIERARDLALVTGLSPNITSYSGFFTVDEACDSNLFFWFFPSQVDWLNDPVTLWLNGGPGQTSLLGLLVENGPYTLSLDGELSLREFSWNRKSSVIYIDSPVGTGFSFTARDSCYATEQTQVGRDLVNALEQFFVMFPEISSNPFFLTGESYAGKYIPAVAYTIHATKSRINLQGLALGDAFVDPVNQLLFADMLFHNGFADEAFQASLTTTQNNIVRLIHENRLDEAKTLYHTIPVAIGVSSGIHSLYNFLHERPEAQPDILTFVNEERVRSALHVGNATFNTGSTVYSKLSGDFLKSVKPWLEQLLELYRVLIYNGQMDIAVPYVGTVNYITTLNWTGRDAYGNAGRRQWMVGKRLAGYAKTAGKLTEVLVRNAGHLTPLDQPEWTWDLYNRFISNTPF